MKPRNSKGQFARKTNNRFRLIVLLLIIIPAIMYFFSLPKTYNEEKLPADLFSRCEKVSPVPCDELYAVNDFSDHLDKVENPTFWKDIPNPKDKEISELKEQLNQRWDSMSTEDKVRMIFGRDGDDAVKVFTAESGLRSVCNDGLNTNGTVDCGVAQINSVHGVPRRLLLDEDINIMVAKNIFDNRGNWSAWYASYVLER